MQMKMRFQNILMCDVNPTGAGCPNSMVWMNDRQQMKNARASGPPY